MSTFFLTPGKIKLLDCLKERLESTEVEKLSIASAFVTMGGVLKLNELIKDVRVNAVNLLAGIDLCITHPKSLQQAKVFGWDVKIPTKSAGLFHPKFILGSNAKNKSGALYIGSANLTSMAFDRNLESCFVTECDISEPLSLFENIWSSATEASDRIIEEYSLRFAIENSKRTAEHLIAVYGDEKDLEAAEDQSTSGLNPLYASSVWVELKSFTGDYTLQAEFPTGVAMILQQFVEGKFEGERVEMVCDDGKLRSLLLRFYKDNSMYRVNIPNSVPNIDWVRENKEGIALIEKTSDKEHPIRLKVLAHSHDRQEVIKRSLSLNSLFATSTRQYGWF